MTFDVLVKKELGEDAELLAQKLVGEIDGSVHHAHAMRTNGRCDGLDVDGVQMFGVLVCAALKKDLLVEVVVES